MNILNKQTVILTSAAVFAFVLIETGFAQKQASGAASMRKGVELAQKKQFDAAIAEFTKYINANPKDPAGYGNRASAYVDSARFAEAAEDFSKLIELRP